MLMLFSGSRTKVTARATRRGGFSLIEVALALGVFSFAILPGIGLMGGSLKSHRTATVTSLPHTDPLNSRNLYRVQIAALPPEAASDRGSIRFQPQTPG